MVKAGLCDAAILTKEAWVAAPLRRAASPIGLLPLRQPPPLR